MNLKAISLALSVAPIIEDVLSKDSTMEKVDAAIDAAPAVISVIEQVLGKDLVNQDAVKPAFEAVKLAVEDLLKAVDAVKAVKK